MTAKSEQAQLDNAVAAANRIMNDDRELFTILAEVDCQAPELDQQLAVTRAIMKRRREPRNTLSKM